MTEPEPGPSTGSIGQAVVGGEPDHAPVPDWPAVLRTQAPWLRRVVSARLGERQAVDEVMQEVALAVVAQRAPLLHPGRVLGWLYRLAVRQALMYRRKAGRQRALLGRYSRQRPGDEVDPSPSPLGWLLHEERRSLIRQALRQLPPRDADLLTLRYAEGWSVAELAANLDVSASAVEARLHRARGRLRLALAELTEEFAPDERTEHERP
ncbi:MAG: sigma-70 family RNA polymerase sigma factor [Isosphaeraceae bacterium]